LAPLSYSLLAFYSLPCCDTDSGLLPGCQHHTVWALQPPKS
jgi:hypothetical protein